MVKAGAGKELLIKHKGQNDHLIVMTCLQLHLFAFSLHCASRALLLVRSLRTNLWLIKLAVTFIESVCVAAVDGCRSKKHNISLLYSVYAHTHTHTHTRNLPSSQSWTCSQSRLLKTHNSSSNVLKEPRLQLLQD